MRERKPLVPEKGRSDLLLPVSSPKARFGIKILHHANDQREVKIVNAVNADAP